MKSLFFALLILLVISTSCGPVQEAGQGPLVQDIKITIEYRNENNAREHILQLLRPAKPKDIMTTGGDLTMETEAIFTGVSRNDFELIERIEQQIKMIQGVFNVELKRPARPVMQTGYRAP